MTVPQWALLGFAVWTLLVLFGTVGVYRWSRILTGRVRISEWQADVPQGSEWYLRAMRAHMNCVENLPVFAAIVRRRLPRNWACPSGGVAVSTGSRTRTARISSLRRHDENRSLPVIGSES
jgi:hypothetical protein